MKKYIYSLFAAALLVLCAGCSKDDDGPKIGDSGIVGEWRLTEWIGETHPEFDVYTEFLANGKFHIYEKVETSIYVKYSGDFTATDTRISGRYDSGLSWKTDYAFALSGDGKTLTMTSNTDKSDVSVYTRTSIPEAVRNVREVRSGLPDGFRPFL